MVLYRLPMPRRSPSLFTPATSKSGEHVLDISRLVKAQSSRIPQSLMMELSKREVSKTRGPQAPAYLYVLGERKGDP